MKTMAILLFGAFAFLSAFVGAADITDVYEFKARLRVPQVIDNWTSEGKRVDRRQSLVGHLCVTYRDGKLPILWFSDLTNTSYRVSGKCVGYAVAVDDGARWNLVGSNKTGIFKRPSIAFSVVAEPDYIHGEEPSDDNSFILSLAGYGPNLNYIHGYVAGTQGCGCKSYGHISPTRVAGPYGATDKVDDVAKVTGTWRAKFVKRKTH